MERQTKSRIFLPTVIQGGDKTTVTKSVFDELPDSAFLREAQLVRSPKRPGYPAPLPFSAPTLWRMVKAGKFPAPMKLSERVTGWRVSEVRAWLLAQGASSVRVLS